MKDDNMNPLEEKIAMEKHIQAMEFSFLSGCIVGAILAVVAIFGIWGLIWLVTNVKL